MRLESNPIKIFVLPSGEQVIAEILEESTFLRLKNPLTIFPVEEGKIQFIPTLFSNPKEMECNLRNYNYDYIPDPSIIEGYKTYVSQLTSSIIQLDKKVKVLNG